MTRTHIWMIWYASVIHIAWGIGALLDNQIRDSSFLNELATLVGNNTAITGVVYFVVGMLSIIGSTKFLLSAFSLRNRQIISIGLALPQQILLFVSAAGFAFNLATGTLPEIPDQPVHRGTIYPAAIVAFSSFLFHTFALLDHATKGRISQLATGSVRYVA